MSDRRHYRRYRRFRSQPDVAGIVAFILLGVGLIAIPALMTSNESTKSVDQPGVMILPYFSLSEMAWSFEQKAYDLGWVMPDFDWGARKQTPEAISLRDDDQASAQATPDQLARLLTVCIRQDRFCEGTLEGAFESGLLTRILERAAVLLRELEPQAPS
jgi:hypothetical protein